MGRRYKSLWELIEESLDKSHTGYETIYGAYKDRIEGFMTSTHNGSVNEEKPPKVLQIDLSSNEYRWIG